MYDPSHRDRSWQMVLPGCYVDPAGCAHIFPDEIIAQLQLLHPQAGFNYQEDYQLVVKCFSQMLRQRNPGLEIRIIKHTREAEA